MLNGKQKRYLRSLAVNEKGARFAGPFKSGQVNIPVVFEGRRHPVDKVGRRGCRGLAAAGQQKEAKAGEREGVGKFHHLV